MAIIGNGLVIFLVCRKQQLRTKTNAFIVSLAVADFCVGMTAVPLRFFCHMVNGCSSPASSVGHLSTMFIRVLFQYASGTNLCSLVLDRYIAVVKPLKYLTFMKRRRVIQMISLSWGIPLLVITLVSSLRFSLKTQLLYTISGWLYMVFDLPLCVILIFCFASTLRIVYKHEHSARILAKQLRFNHEVLIKTQDKSTVQMMAVVVALFLLCYVIFMRCSFVLILNSHNACQDNAYKLPILISNSVANPLAYAFFKRDIKKEFKKLMHH